MSVVWTDFGRKIVYTAADREALKARETHQPKKPLVNLEVDEATTAHFHPTNLLSLNVVDYGKPRILKPSDIYDIHFGKKDAWVQVWSPRGINLLCVPELNEDVLQRAIYAGIANNPGAPLDIAKALARQETPKFGDKLRAMLSQG
jgi:hypothetical protein